MSRLSAVKLHSSLAPTGFGGIRDAKKRRKIIRIANKKDSVTTHFLLLQESSSMTQFVLFEYIARLTL